MIAAAIIPAYRELQAFFDDVYLPAGLPEVGIVAVCPTAATHYAARCREFTTTQLTPDEIHQIGLDEVNRIRARMEAVVREVKFHGHVPGVSRTPAEQSPVLLHRTPTNCCSRTRAICKTIDPQLVKLFKTLPRIPYGVEPIPEHIAPDTTTAYYRPPAADGSRAGTYFVNLYRPEVAAEVRDGGPVAARSGPRHHLQIALAQELGDLPHVPPLRRLHRLRRRLGLYAESLGEDLGLLRGSLLAIRPADLRDVARRAAGRRYRHAPQALDARASDRLLHGRTPPRPSTTSSTRSTATSPGPARPWPTRSAS